MGKNNKNREKYEEIIIFSYFYTICKKLKKNIIKIV